MSLVWAGCGSEPAAPQPPAPPSFTLRCEPALLRVEESVARASCTATSANGFAGALLFRCTSQPSGLSCLFEPPSLDVPAAGSGSTTVSFGPGLLLSPGPHTVQIAATGGGLTGTFDLGVTVGERCSGFREQPSYAGDCRSRPSGTICWGFSDGYIWLANDGFGAPGYTYVCGEQTVFAARGGRADYHHVLGTLYVKTTAPTR